GPAQPGTACNDNDPLTGNDTWSANCVCAGQLIDCLGVPGGTATVGSACNDNNAATGNDVYGANCVCAGQLIDCQGTPGGTALPGTACNDNNPNTSGDTWSANCVCAGVLPNDCEGTPGGPAQPGTACNDNDPLTGNDTWSANCVCAGTPIGCTQPVTLVLHTDVNGGQTTWEVLPQGGGLPVCSGGPYGALNNPAFVSELCCLSEGCYVLRVLDSAGDGMTTGGYVLQNSTGARIIDNANDGVFGSVSQISGGQGFCLPIGSDRLINTSCDKIYWVTGDYITASVNPAVSAQWLVGNQTDDGYEFWFFDPDGTYSFRRFRDHATSDGYAPANATRACHAKLNNWAAANQLPVNVLLNVRVRTRVNGVSNQWGPACRFKLNPVLAQCPPTMLVNEPGIPEYSCGVTRRFGSNDKVYCWSRPGANRYQFEFTLSGEVFLKTVTATTSYINLNWVANPLLDGNTYTVRARISKNAGVSWCTWGDPCLLTIDNTPLQGGDQRDLSVDAAGEELHMWPNPNNGDQLFLALDVIEPSTDLVTVDVFDIYGKRVIAKMLPAPDGHLNTVLDLDAELAGGVYILHLAVGDRNWTERLVIQR
ncbi:MAG: T9SS type A sorting domain-containing protein, partial [Flavobacteriales bacterium]